MSDEKAVALDETRRCIYMLLASDLSDEPTGALAGTVFNALAHHDLGLLDSDEASSLVGLITEPKLSGDDRAFLGVVLARINQQT